MCEEGRDFVWRGAGIEVPTQVPGCIADALCAAKAVPPPRQGLNALAGEWAAAREWTLYGRAALPVGKERAFLRARGVRGEGMLMVNGNEAGRFLSDGRCAAVCLRHAGRQKNGQSAGRPCAAISAP